MIKRSFIYQGDFKIKKSWTFLIWFFISVTLFRVMDNRKTNRNPPLRILYQIISQRFPPKNATYRLFTNLNVQIDSIINKNITFRKFL